MFLAEQAAAVSTVDQPAERAQFPRACRVGTRVVSRRFLPVVPSHQFFRVYRLFCCWSSGCAGTGAGVGGRPNDRLCLVRLKNVEPAQGLVDDIQRLELFCFADLFVEPALDFVLRLFGEFLVDIVDVSV